MNETLTRAANFEPSTFDAKENSVECVFSTGAEITRNDFEGSYLERLDMSVEAVDLTQLQGGPVLDNHDRFSGVRAILGLVEKASVDGTRGLARLRFSTRPDVAEIANDVKNGIIRNVSVGYKVQQWTTSKRADGMRVKTATKWQPFEISFTPLGADPGATVRSKENSTMNPQEQIRQMATAVGVIATFAEGLITRNATVEEARAAILEEAVRMSPTIINRAPANVTRETSTEDMTRAAADAFYHRINTTHVVPELGRQFVGNRMADFARVMLRARNVDSFGSDAEVVTRSLNTTSDFSNLLSNLTNKSLQAQYAQAPSGMKVVCRRGTVNDFKPKNILRRGEMPTLEKINEKGEFKRGSTVESKEAYSIATYGKVFGMTRQMLINDDLGTFSDIASGWGMAAVEFENQLLAQLLTTGSGLGPTLANDAKRMFHTDHGNIQTVAGTIGSTTLSEARLSMRNQKGLNGTIAINATPKYLLVPAKLETVAEQYLSAIYPTAATDVNPFSGKLQLVVDPRLDTYSTTRWYVFADPAILPVIEYSYLSGFEGLFVETRNGFETDGIEIKARLDFGAGGIDYRGAFTNVGV